MQNYVVALMYSINWVVIKEACQVCHSIYKRFFNKECIVNNQGPSLQEHFKNLDIAQDPLHC